MGGQTGALGKVMDLLVMTACVIISVLGIAVVYSWNDPHEREWDPWTWKTISSWMVVVSTVTAQLVRRGALSWTIFLVAPKAADTNKDVAASMGGVHHDHPLPHGFVPQHNLHAEPPRQIKWGRIFATTYGVGNKAKVVYLFLVVLAPVLSFIPIRFVNEESFQYSVTDNARQLYFHASDTNAFAYSTTGVYEAIKLAYRYSNNLLLRTQDIHADTDSPHIYLPRKMPQACRHNLTEVTASDILVGQYSCTSTPNAPQNDTPADSCGAPPPTKVWGAWETNLDITNIMRHAWLDVPPNTPDAKTTATQGICLHYSIRATDTSPPISTTFSCTAQYFNATANVAWRANASECWIDSVLDVSPLTTQYTTNPRLLRPMRELNIAITNALIGAVNATQLAAYPANAEATVGTIFTAATLLRSLYRDACSAAQIESAQASGQPSHCALKAVTYTDWQVRRGFENGPLQVMCVAYGVLSLGAYLSFVVFEMFTTRPQRFWDEVTTR